MSDSVQPHRSQPIRFSGSWGSPGKNTGVGCHFFLRCMKMKSESEVSCIRLFVTPWTAANQAPLSMGFSRQEYWSGGPLPSAMLCYAKLLQSCPTLCDPMDCSQPGSSVHVIFQARVLEWVAIAFSRVLSTMSHNYFPVLCLL